LVSAGRADERMEEIHNREIINKNGIAWNRYFKGIFTL
jgi:hypothetical protein